MTARRKASRPDKRVAPIQKPPAEYLRGRFCFRISLSTANIAMELTVPSCLSKVAGLALFAVVPSAMAAPPPDSCVPGFYRLADGAGIDVAPSDAGHLRWRALDGTSGYLSPLKGGKWSSALGWTNRPDGKVIDLSRCTHGEIDFAGTAGHRVPFETIDTRFMSDGTELAGRLVLPEGQEPVPVVVLVHGSEDTSALRFYALQRLLPAEGVGVFVYDKRGTGDSKGAFTHDLHVLATDANAALATAKRLAGPRANRIGFYGTSQGGWTAPLAAAQSHPDFVIVGYGLAVTPLDEDREAIELNMVQHGFGATETAKALEIGAATATILRSHFQSGYDELRRVVAKYKNEPWFPFVRGDVTGILIRMSEAELRVQGPRMLPDIIPDYDPMPVLGTLKTPQLWILGGEDIDAPYRETYRRLMSLKKDGHPIAIVVYPHVEHGLYAFETKGEERLSTRQPVSLERLLAGFARTQAIRGPYDDAEVVP